MDKTKYWLKIKKEYLSSLPLKKMRKCENGNAMIIAYLKMQLQALETEGLITFLGVGENIAEEISLTIEEDLDIVNKTLDFLIKYGMAYVEDSNNLYFSEVIENTEKETGAAERMRRMRERREENV